MSTVEFRVHLSNGAKGRKRMRSGPRPEPQMVKTRIPRVARLMALAIHFDQLIREGIVEDYADLARLGGVSRARISQIMDLLNLAPDLQEEILLVSRTNTGRHPISERELRAVNLELDWIRQRQAANELGSRSAMARRSPGSQPRIDHTCSSRGGSGRILE